MSPDCGGGPGPYGGGAEPVGGGVQPPVDAVSERDGGTKPVCVGQPVFRVHS